MAQRRQKGRSGGAATAAGADFQARLAAWMACAILAETDATPLWDWQSTETFESVFAETEEPTDDLLVTNSGGARAYIQAKFRLQLSDRPGSPFGSAVDQFVGQFRAWEGEPRPHDRVVLAVGPESSAPIRNVLPRILRRLQNLPEDRPISDAARGTEERRVLKVITDQVSRAWSAEVGSEPSDDDVRTLLRCVRVSVHDLYGDGAELREADGLLRRSILRRSSEAARVWAEIVSLAARFNADQTGANRAQLQELLAALGVELRAAPSYRADIEKLVAHSRRTTERLSTFATVKGESGEPVKIDRAAPSALRTALEQRSVVVTGDPGAGKSATLFEFANAVCSSRDLVALASDMLNAGSLGELRTELGLEHDVIEVLRNWPGAEDAILVVDALDAARGEHTQEALLDLIGIVDGGAERWRIAASIRRFDLRGNADLQAIFASSEVVADPEFQSPEFSALSHINVPLLSDAELGQLSERAPSLHAVIESASDQLRTLVRVPFNLRLLADLVSLNVARAELDPITTQLQLLDKYWEHRVLGAGAGGDAAESVLRTACEQMIAQRSMRVDRSTLQPDPSFAQPVTEILSNQVLAEEQVDGLVRREVIAFAHHVLFDYAVARLLFRGTEDAIVRRTREQPELLLVVRPSYDLHFRHLWESNPDRRAFWDLAIEIAGEADVPQIGKIIGPGVAASLIEGVDDIVPLLDELDPEGSRTEASEDVVRHLTGARLAETSASGPIPPNRRQVWCEVALALSDRLRSATAFPLRSLLMELCSRPDELDANQQSAAGTAARRLLEWAWASAPENRYLVIAAIEAVVRTFESGPEASERLLRRILEPQRLSDYGFLEMPELARESPRLVAHAPHLVRDIYAAAFAFEEESKERTQMSGGVVALTSNRRQDYEMSHYALEQAFADFLRAAPEEAIDALSAVRTAYSQHRGNGEGFGNTLEVPWSGEGIQIQPDGSYIWDSGGLSHDEEVKMLDSFQAWVADVAASEGAAGAERLVKTLRRTPRPAALWRRVLRVAADAPEAFAPVLEPVVVAPDVLVSSDLSSLVGDFITSGFPHLDQDAQERVEQAITGLPEALVAADANDQNRARERGEHARDRLLGCLDREALVTAGAQERLDELRDADAIPANVPPIGPIEITSSEYGEQEYLDEQGVDVAAEPNRRMRELEGPTHDFADKYMNDAPPPDKVAAIEQPLRELWDALATAEADGVDARQADYGWGYASAAADAIARAQDLPPDSSAVDLAIEVLLASARHPRPEPVEDTSSFDEFPSWGFPSPRIEAASGLVAVVLHAADAGEEVLTAIEELSADDVPAVRMHVAQRLHWLRRNTPDLMWRIAGRMANEDSSRAVLTALVSALPRMTLPDDPERLEHAVRAIFERGQEQAPGAGKVRETCIDVMTDLYIWRGHDGAGEFVRDTVIANLASAPDDAAHIVHHLRDALTHGAVQPSAPSETAIRQRAVELGRLLLDCAISTFDALQMGFRGRTDLAEDDPEVTRARTTAHIIDGIASEIYFATGAFDERQGRGTPPDPKQRERLYREVAPLLDAVCEVGMPSVTHHVLESLEVFIHFDARGVFLRISRTVRAGQAGDYQFDSLGASLVVRLVERYLAEHRTLLQEDDECRRELVEVLDIFVQAGWPDARRLTYGLQDIFR